MAVSTGAIVEHLDVIVDLGIGNITSLVDVLLDPLLLQAAKQRFGHRVIPAVSTPAHTGLKMMHMAEAPPRIAAKLRSKVARKYRTPGLRLICQLFRNRAPDSRGDWWNFASCI